MTLSRQRNIGIIAHVDAGKTTVTERILFYAGAIHATGDVHHGNTRTDFDPQERKHGITIYSAATTVYWNDHRITMIDTPGHIDFNIEVERSLRVLDGAVVVFDAVAGVEPQTETNWRLADRHQVPRICFVNKMDRVGADYWRTVAMIEARLGTRVVPVQIPLGCEDGFYGVIDLIAEQAYIWPQENTTQHGYRASEIPAELHAEVEQHRAALIEIATEFDDEVLEAYLNGQVIAQQQLLNALRRGVLQHAVMPILCGSAFKHKGIELLLDAVVAYLPSPQDRPVIVGTHPDSGCDVQRSSSLQQPFAALAFKVINDKHGPLTFVRVYSGQAKVGDVLLNPAANRRERISRVFEMQADRREPQQQLQAGDIVAIAGLKQTTTGDTLCALEQPLVLERITVPERVIDIAVEPQRSADQGALAQCLHRFVSEDPSLAMKQEPETGQLILSGMGELQLQIVLEKLAEEFKLPVNTGKPKVNYRETITATVEKHYVYSKQTGGPGQFAEVLIRLEPLARGAGIEFAHNVIGGAVPAEFIPSVEAGIRQTANAGVLAGFPVIDFKATLLDGAFHAKDSSALAFATAARLVFAAAAREAEPVLLEPMMQVEVDTAADHLGDCIGDLNRRRGLIQSQERSTSGAVIQAHVPLAEMFGYIGDLRAITSGRASFTMQFDHYAKVPAKRVAALSG